MRIITPGLGVAAKTRTHGDLDHFFGPRPEPPPLEGPLEDECPIEHRDEPVPAAGPDDYGLNDDDDGFELDDNADDAFASDFPPVVRTEGQRAIAGIARDVALAEGDKIDALRESAIALRRRADAGQVLINRHDLAQQIWNVADAHDLRDGPGRETRIAEIERAATMPDWADVVTKPDRKTSDGSKVLPRTTVTPCSWKGTPQVEDRFVVENIVPVGEITIFAGDGGSGKTHATIQLGIEVAAAPPSSSWLGRVVNETGPVYFLSCEEQQNNVRNRLASICKHRELDPENIPNLHFDFPDLEQTWLVRVNPRTGELIKTDLFLGMEAWIDLNKPRLVVIDNVAAVFGAPSNDKLFVRPFLAMITKIARRNGCAIVLVDHPSVRGKSDGTGTAGAVDWRNAVRSMITLGDPLEDEPDVQILTVGKNNRVRNKGEQVRLRWNGLMFTTDVMKGLASPAKAAAEHMVDELFLRLLDKFAAQGRDVRSTTGSGYAPSEFVKEPEVKVSNVTKKALGDAMVRLFDAGKIVIVEGKRSKHIERAPS